MVKKWLHLNFYVGNPWGFRLVAAIDKAVKEGKVPAPSHEQGQMPLYIATRLDMVRRVDQRIYQECQSLYEIAKKHETWYEFSPGKQAYAITVDEDLKFNLMIDIDSILFEL